jgi:hypothetical protein
MTRKNHISDVYTEKIELGSKNYILYNHYHGEFELSAKLIKYDEI